MYIEIVLCQEIYLQPNEKCASQELPEEFFKQPLNTVVLQVHYKSLNSRDGSEQTQMKNCYTLNTFLSSNLYEVQDSFLFVMPKYFEYIIGSSIQMISQIYFSFQIFSIQTQTNSFEYCKQIYQNDGINLHNDERKSNKTIFQYPHAGDLLANIGSIVSVLFMIKHVIIILNEYYLKQKVLKEVISFYYPELKNILINKNWKQNNKEYFKLKRFIENLIIQSIDVIEYKRFYKKVKKQMKVKLSYLNMLYEISRICFILRSSNYRQELKKSHSVGIKMALASTIENFLDSGPNSNLSNRMELNHIVLNDEDSNLLSLTMRNQIPILDQLQEEICSENNFFEINKIK